MHSHQKKAYNEKNGYIPAASSGAGLALQRKLTVGSVNDPLEAEADAMADRVMRMPDTPLVQRKCNGECEEESKRMHRKPLASEITPFIQAKSEESATSSSDAVSSRIESTRGGGSPLPASTRSFMESRFGADFSEVRIHSGANAAELSTDLNAQAFTVGKDIYFNQGHYQPHSESGKQLLAHELTHTLQQGSIPAFAQRKKYSGKDDAGAYEIDDKSCTLNYHQDWYFNFGDAIEPANQPAYMASGKSQVESNWSNKYKLISGNSTCACGDNGFTVDVKLNTFNKQREGKHGYTINVEKNRSRSFTNPLTGTIKMSDTADVPKNFGYTYPMDTMAHEFGHTLGLEDEYNWWAALFGVAGSGDKSSLMNRGNEVKPWHYQHFADILNLELEKCTFYPEGGVKGSSLTEPVAQIGLTTGAAFKSASLDRSKAEFVIGLNIDRRVSNNAVLGLFYPTLGFDAYWNVTDKTISTGPTAGLRLNRIVHPLYLDISTGILLTPEAGGEKTKLNIPLSTTLGLRGKGFNAGVNYTPMVDVLAGGKYSHIIGVNMQFDL